jgi:hypothetical protein
VFEQAVHPEGMTGSIIAKLLYGNGFMPAKMLRAQLLHLKICQLVGECLQRVHRHSSVRWPSPLKPSLPPSGQGKDGGYRPLSGHRGLGCWPTRRGPTGRAATKNGAICRAVCNAAPPPPNSAQQLSQITSVWRHHRAEHASLSATVVACRAWWVSCGRRRGSERRRGGGAGLYVCRRRSVARAALRALLAGGWLHQQR